MVDRARDRNLAAAPKVLIEQLVDLVRADALRRAVGAVRRAAGWLTTKLRPSARTGALAAEP